MTRPISVAFDMTFANRNQAGSGVYARSLLSALRERDDVTPWIIEGPRRSNIVRTTRWLMRGARKSLQQRPPQVLHCPSFVAPWSVNLPLVVTVHDAAGTRYPADHPLEWRAYERLLMPPRLRSAVRIITGSEFARSELIEVYRLQSDRVVCVPYGLDPQFLAYAEGGKRRDRAPVLLFPGAPIGRKNLDVVLQAMAHAQPHSELAVAELHISGAREEDFSAYARQIRALGLAGRVRWLGTVPFSDLPATFAAATVMVYPSLYEGFGFPPLEAMAVGTPVVASRSGSLSEVLGDAALTIDPTRAEELGAALEPVLTNSELRCELIEKGKKRSRLFTWAKCAERTVDVYREAAG